MLTKFFKTLLILFLIILALFSISCRFEELGLSSETEEDPDSQIIKTISEELSGEELFLQLKSKQIDKNPLSDINVRKAIFHAIDRGRIVETLLGEYGGVVNSLFLEDSPFYYDAWNVYEYDVEKAKEYLGKAGYSLENPLYLTIGTTIDSESKIIAEGLIKEDLQKIGINIWFFNKEPKEWYVDYLKNGNFELGIWALYTIDGHNINNYFSSNKVPSMESDTNKNCDNFYWYSNEEVDSLLASLNGDVSDEIRIEIMQQIQQKLADNAFFLPLYRRIFSIAYYKKVKNLDIDKRDGNYLQKANEWILDEEVQAEEDTLSQVNIGYQYEPYTLDPLLEDTSHRDFILSLLSSGLWRLDEFGTYIPNLVDGEITIKENDVKALLRTRVKLREDIFWEDGSLIDSQDIKDTMDFILSSNLKAVADRDYSIIKEIIVINDKEFEVVFYEYKEGWQGLFDFVFPSDIVLENNISDFMENDFYSYGPFILSEWIKGDHMFLDRNDNYYGKLPDIDRLNVVFNSDINYLIGYFREGEIDVLNIPADLSLIEDIKAGESVDVLVEPGNLWEHLALSLKPEE